MLVFFNIYGHGRHVGHVTWMDRFNDFSSPRSLEATNEIWFQLAQLLQRRSRLKLWMDDDGDFPSYKLPPGDFSSGELKWRKLDNKNNMGQLSLMMKPHVKFQTSFL